MKHIHWTLLPLLLSTSLAYAELQEVTDADLADVSGQAGIYLSGDISINENGGPLWTCQADGSGCGARVTMKPREDGGWFVLDDIRGSFCRIRSKCVMSDSPLERLTTPVRNMPRMFPMIPARCFAKPISLTSSCKGI